MHSAWRRGVIGLALCHLIFVLGYLGTIYVTSHVHELTLLEKAADQKAREALSNRDSIAMKSAVDEMEVVYQRMIPYRNGTLMIAGITFLTSLVQVWVAWQLTSESVARIEIAARVASLLFPVLIILTMFAPTNTSLTYLDGIAGGLIIGGLSVALSKIGIRTDNREITRSVHKAIKVGAGAYILAVVMSDAAPQSIERFFLLVFFLCTVWYCATLVKLWKRL